jgi:hypothetical protein
VKILWLNSLSHFWGSLHFYTDENELQAVKLRYPAFIYDLTYGVGVSLFTRAKIALGSGATPNLAAKHFFWEVSIPLVEITDGAKDSVDISVITNGKTLDFESFDTNDNPVIVKRTRRIKLAGPVFDRGVIASSTSKPEEAAVPTFQEDGSIVLTFPDGKIKKFPGLPDMPQINAPPAILPGVPNDPKAQMWLKWLSDSLLEMITQRLPPGSQQLKELRKREKGQDLYEIATSRLRYFSVLQITK